MMHFDALQQSIKIVILIKDCHHALEVANIVNESAYGPDNVTTIREFIKNLHYPCHSRMMDLRHSFGGISSAYDMINHSDIVYEE